MSQWRVKHLLLSIIAGLFAGLLILLLHMPLGSLPPLAGLLSPMSGVARLHPQLAKGTNQVLKTPEGNLIEIQYDDRGVPHVFANRVEDGFFAQGFLMARDRLWQMDIMYRKFSGHLAEIVGRSGLASDRQQRLNGVTLAIERLGQAMLADSETRAAAQAYVAGVNQWIDRLHAGSEDMPMGFRIMNYHPEYWTVFKTAAIFRLMAWNLSGAEAKAELHRTAADLHLGAELFSSLFPKYLPFGQGVFGDWKFQVPIHVGGSRRADKGWQKLRLPRLEAPPDGHGSNVWAVSKQRSSSGNPLLANDPHLFLTLPPIWYEMQMSTPEWNVYGVSIPGIPGVTIGFSKNVAWGFTNAGIDVLDYYRVTFEDDRQLRYRSAGKWREVRITQEVILVRGEQEETVRVRWTEHGPLSRTIVGVQEQGEIREESLAMRWLGHDVSNEFKALVRMLPAEDCDAFDHALADFIVPAQNVACIDRRQTPRLFMAGRIPIRGSHDGYTIGDADDPTQNWQGFLPYSENPRRESSIVLAANQKPITSSNGMPLTGNYAPFQRNTRIARLLEQKQHWDLKGFQAMQLDVKNPLARAAVPLILAILPEKGLSITEQKAYTILRDWDYAYEAHSAGAALFESIWQSFDRALRRTLFADEADQFEGLIKDDILLALLQGEIRLERTGWEISDIIIKAFHSEVAELAQKQGANPESWQWRKVQAARVPHLLKIAAFGFEALEVGGMRDVLNAIDKDHGPSWRMTVELSPSGPIAFGVYPGGAHEQPMHPAVARGLHAWRQGHYFPLQFWEKNVSSPTSGS